MPIRLERFGVKPNERCSGRLRANHPFYCGMQTGHRASHTRCKRDHLRLPIIIVATGTPRRSDLFIIACLYPGRGIGHAKGDVPCGKDPLIGKPRNGIEINLIGIPLLVEPHYRPRYSSAAFFQQAQMQGSRRLKALPATPGFPLSVKTQKVRGCIAQIVGSNPRRTLHLLWNDFFHTMFAISAGNNCF